MTTNLARYQRIAPFYDLLDFPFERRRYRALRPLMFQNLGGWLLDAGVGTGRNCAFYPPDAIVSGIDTSLAMLERAHGRCPILSAAGRLYQMDVTELEFPTGSFDARWLRSYSVCCRMSFRYPPFGNSAAWSSRVGLFGSWSMCVRMGPSGGSCRGFGSRGLFGRMGRASITRPNGMSPRRALSSWRAGMSSMIS